jgi:hypothetical protein
VLCQSSPITYEYDGGTCGAQGRPSLRVEVVYDNQEVVANRATSTVEDIRPSSTADENTAYDTNPGIEELKKSLQPRMQESLQLLTSHRMPLLSRHWSP